MKGGNHMIYIVAYTNNTYFNSVAHSVMGADYIMRMYKSNPSVERIIVRTSGEDVSFVWEREA